MAEPEQIFVQTAADVATPQSPSPSTLALSSSAPAVEHSLLPSASAAAGARLCSAGSLQLCCLRRPELPSAAPSSGRAGQQWAFPCLCPSGSGGQWAEESGRWEPCRCPFRGALAQG